MDLSIKIHPSIRGYVAARPGERASAGAFWDGSDLRLKALMKLDPSGDGGVTAAALTNSHLPQSIRDPLSQGLQVLRSPELEPRTWWFGPDAHF